MNRLLLATLALLFASGVSAQTTLLQETFETDGEGSRYALSQVSCNDGDDYFSRTDGSDVGNTYNSPQGTFFFAAQDLDGAPCSANPSTLTISGIDISGATGLQFAGLFAEGDDGTNQDWDELDFVHVDYQIDGGGYVNLFWLENDGATFNSAPFVDTDFDGTGDGTEITDTFAEFTAAIAGTGSLLDLRVTFSLDSGDEDIAIDDLRITGTVGAGGDTVTQPLVFTTPGDPNSAAGWRHLSPPVEGFDIDDLAALNLVQGVPAGATNPQQYPSFGDIVFPSVDASGFVPPVDTDEVIASGQGFFWYLYDRTFTPNPLPGNGTSTSLELTGFELTATGTVPSSDVMFSPPNYSAAPTKGIIANRSFLIGNPFGQDLNVGGITANVPLQTTFQTWNPGSGSYVAFEAGTGTENLAVWQGTFAETSDLDTAPTFTYAAASRTGSATAPFYGRPAARPDAISLRLSGRGDNGASITDELAVIRFSDAASTGWDLLDASKLTPPTVAYGLLAPVMDRDGSPWRTAINTLPTESVTVPVDFIATEAGTFFVGADVTIFGGATVRLRDLVTGAEHDFASGDYTFESDATDWTSRFEVVVSFASTAGEPGAETAFRLTAPAPNPARAETRMTLMTSTAQTVRAAIYDALGREVSVLHDGPLAAGASTTLTVDTASLAPGVYVVRAQGETMAQTQRLTVTR